MSKKELGNDQRISKKIEFFQETDPQWPAEEGALCREFPIEWWFQDGGYHKKARAICAECPVLNKCRDYGLYIQEHHDPKLPGVYGGLGFKDRKQIIIQRRKDRKNAEAGQGEAA